MKSPLSYALLRILFELEFSPCKTGQPLEGTELQEKKEEKDKKHIGKLFREYQKTKHV